MFFNVRVYHDTLDFDYEFLLFSQVDGFPPNFFFFLEKELALEGRAVTVQSKIYFNVPLGIFFSLEGPCLYLV